MDTQPPWSTTTKPPPNHHQTTTKPPPNPTKLPPPKHPPNHHQATTKPPPPQELSNNGSDWLRLERWAKSLLKHFPDVYVVSGPLFLPQPEPERPTPPPQPDSPQRTPPVRKRISYDVIGRHEVAVPTHL